MLLPAIACDHSCSHMGYVGAAALTPDRRGLTPTATSQCFVAVGNVFVALLIVGGPLIQEVHAMPSMASATALILYSASHHSVSYYKQAKRLSYCLSVMSMY